MLVWFFFPLRFDDEEQQELSVCGVYLDPEYSVLWSYSAEENRMCCFNPITANIEGECACKCVWVYVGKYCSS